MNKTLIFFPCYNVEKKIEIVIKKISKKIILDKKIKLLFINDKSTDHTKNEIRKIIKRHNLNGILLNNKKN